MAPAAAPKRRPQTGRRDDIRERLHKVVEDLVSSGESYSNVTIDRLAASAGISRATFYTYFADKADLLRTSLRGALDDLAAATQAWRALPASPSQTELRDALSVILQTYRTHSTLMSAAIDEASRDPVLRSDLTNATNTAFEALRSRIEHGQSIGSIDPQLLPRETAGWLTAMLERALTQIAPTGNARQLNALTKALSDIVWHVLYTQSPTSAGPQTA